MEQFYNPDIIQNMRREKDARIRAGADVDAESKHFLRDEAEIIEEQTRAKVNESISTNHTREEIKKLKMSRKT